MPPPSAPSSAIVNLSDNMKSETQAAQNKMEIETLQSEAGRISSQPPTVFPSSSSELSSISASSMLEPPSLADIANTTTAKTAEVKSSPPKKRGGVHLKLNVSSEFRNIKPSPLLPSATQGSQLNTASQKSPSVRRQKSGSKSRKARKSGRNEDDDDGVIKAGKSASDSDSPEPYPTTTQTKSGRQIHRPTVLYKPENKPSTSASPDAQQPPKKRRRIYRKGKEVNVLCLQCDRGHSPDSNVIVFCDDCNGTWHQFCHDPPIEKEVVAVKEKEWFCSECRPVDASSSLTQGKEVEPTATAASKQITQPLTSNAPSGLVRSSRLSVSERRAYLSNLSHSTLVDLILDISSRRPDILIYPSNFQDRLLPASNSGTGTTQPAVESKLKEPITPRQSNQTLDTQTVHSTPLPAISPTQRLADSNLEDDDSDVEDYRLYPRTGNGFRLPAYSDDLDMLLEDPASSTFSHTLYRPATAGVTGSANPLQMVGGVA
ncbi:hypothetical protein FQN57_000015 [Myotisia sp. PD_48]|nr:hypothetical protein FQN57_000015 [Myotisia sp. PD_48]